MMKKTKNLQNRNTAGVYYINYVFFVIEKRMKKGPFYVLNLKLKLR
jgi:hypothetical protein